jgi:Protein kinase domain
VQLHDWPSRWHVWTRAREFEVAAAAVADGRDIDWDAFEAGVSSDQRVLLRQLKSLSVTRRQPRRAAKPTTAWRRLLTSGPVVVVTIAGTQIVLAVLAALSLPGCGEMGAAVPGAYTLMMLAFVAAGAILLIGGRGDRKASQLGGFFFVVASAFTAPLTLAWLGRSHGTPALVASRLASLATDAFLPAFLLGFVVEFPRLAGFVRPQEVARRLLSVAWFAGVVLFVANVATFGSAPVHLAPGLSALDRRQPLNSSYWTIVLGLVLAALVLAVWKSRRSIGDESNRAHLLLVAVVGGSAPMALASLMAAAASPVQPWVMEHRVGIGYVVYAGLLTIPASTAYLVLAYRVFEIRLAVRQRLAYVLVRLTLTVAYCLPFVLLGWRIFASRDETLTRVVTERISAMLVVTTVCGATLIACRCRLVASLDCLFFDERRDIRISQNAMAQAGRETADVRGLILALRDEVERSLRTLYTDLLLWDSRIDTYVSAVSGHHRSLPRSSALAAIATDAGEPVTLDLDSRRSVAQLLPEDDRQWLMETGCQLVMKLPGSESLPTALLVLGGKRSDMRYSTADRRFLRALVASAMPLIDTRRAMISLAAPLGQNPTADEAAWECEGCGTIAEDGTDCSCGGRLAAAPVPMVLAGKFRIERRIGRGGMGLVYRALDVALDRVVAIKTLPRVSTSASVRLRREARTMATLEHPHLALILGLETWHGVPMLVVEYLHGGTLAARLQHTRLAPMEAIDLGLALVGAVEYMHRVGLLHRDIKPSNIGFQRDDTPKLLDFGLARILASSDTGRVDWVASKQTWHAAEFMGTPAYLPPEAVRYGSPDPLWDLWSLALVLYESVVGVNPLLSSHESETIARVARAEVPDVRQFAPNCPAGLAEFLAHALSADRRDRPASAAAFKATLASLRTRRSA